MRAKGRIVSRTGLQRGAAIVAAVGFAGLLLFQVALAAGLPLGRAAFGGTSEVLPPTLRVASVVSALLFALAMWAVLARGGVIAVSERAYRLAGWALWAFVALFGLSALANLVSPSPWERLLMAPLALLLTGCCLVVAFASRTTRTAS